MEPQTQQLQFFEIPREIGIRREATQIGRLGIRQDHVVLLAIAALIGTAAVFALGVERGKEFARAERSLLSPDSTAPTVMQGSQANPGGNAATPLAPPEAEVNRSDRKRLPDPGMEPTAPVKAAPGGSRYAIQVVTYSHARFARLELERLKQQGERAFLMVKQNRMVLFVGPFLSKEKASAKLATLRAHYQDCFIRIL